jgi:beta-lactamase regulating signal transducer with metallopeptidase domain
MMLQTAWELLLQVTLWSTVGIALLFAVNRWWPERLANLAWRFLLGIIVLTVLVWVPWPRWMAGGLSVAEHTSVPSQSGDAVFVTSTSPGISFSQVWQTWQKWVPAVPSANTATSTASHTFTWPMALGILATAGMCVGIWRLLVSYRFVQAQLKASQVIDDQRLLEQCNLLIGKLGISKHVQLRASPILHVAATVGTWQPVILLPHNWTSWSEDECRTVLAHELAHIQRSDYLMMVLTQLIAIVYWFHPLVGWLSRYMRAGQELAADALAVHVLGDRTSYLQCLARLALVQDGVRLPAPARLFLSPEVSLLRRIAMLREGSRGVLGQGRLLRWCLALVVLIAGFAVATLRSGVQADDPVRSNTDVSKDQNWQRYVDTDGPGFIVLRPANCLSLESIQPHNKMLNELLSKQLTIGVPLDAIECFMGNLLIHPRINGKVGTGHADYDVNYFRFRTAEAAEAWLKYCVESYQSIERPTGTCFKSTNKSIFNSIQYFLRPDDRTLVFSRSTDEVDRWLSSARQPVTTPKWLKAWPSANEMASMVIHLKHKTVQAMISEVGKEIPLMPMVAPMLPHLVSSHTSVSTADRPVIATRLYCTNHETASTSYKQVEVLINMMKVLRVSGTTNSTPAKEDANHQQLVTLLNSLCSSRENDEVIVSLQSPASLGELFAKQLASINGEQESKINVKIEKK